MTTANDRDPRRIAESHPLHRLFRGLTEHTMHAELGLGDPEIVGYVAGLLVRFVHADAGSPVRDEAGRPVHDLVAVLSIAATSADDDRRRLCFQQAGDLALFWTGVYPEARPRARGTVAPEVPLDLRVVGKRSYDAAGQIARDPGNSSLLHRLAVEFETCADGLARVRKEWESLPRVGADWPRLIAG
jgi:hypothetical protein